MDSPVTPMNSTDNPQALATKDWGQEKLDQEWFNGVVASDELSDASSFIDDNTFEFPKDVPDGPQFKNIGVHIDSVLQSLSKATAEVEFGSQLDETKNQLSPTENRGSSSVLCSVMLVSHADSNVSDNSKSNANEKAQSESSKPVETTFKEENSRPNTFTHVTEPGSDVESVASFDDFRNESGSFSGELKPFAFFPVEDSSTASDHWATGGNEFYSNQACLGEQCSQSDSIHGDGGKMENDDDFGDFEGFETAGGREAVDEEIHGPLQSSGNHALKQTSVLGRLLEHLELSLARAFQPADSSILSDWLLYPPGSIPSKYSVMTEQADPTMIFDQSTFWTKLFTQGRACDLKQQWNKSRLYASYLHSVNVDVRSAMPAFASQLRLLEPIRLGTPNIQTTDSQKSVEETAVTSTHTNSSATCCDRGATVPEFDWTSSGLTNPLCANTTEEQLDLDFFEVQSNLKNKALCPPKNSILSELEQELFASIPQPPSPATQSTFNRTDILRQSSIPSRTLSKPTMLSSTVQAVINKLPKLRYMRARNLIFPVPEADPN